MKKILLLLAASLFCCLTLQMNQVEASSSQDALIQDLPLTQPFYAIAHHVITTSGVKAAAKHGANAIEVDVSSWPSQGGWLADHDHMTLLQAGDSIEKVFNAVTEANNNGGKIRFVWLDIKTPVYVKDQTSPASLTGLQKVAQSLLESHNVYVQFGFTSKDAQKFDIIHNLMNSVTDKESIDLWGDTNQALSVFETYAPQLPAKQRSIDNGLFFIPFGFEYRLKQLEEARQAVQQGKIGRTYSWTVTCGQEKYVNSLLDNARVDGIIYGNPAFRYRDTSANIKTLNSIIDAVKARANMYRLANANDNPW
ncbi:hypothetical protein [Secundilactobacillus kimchicus]|uniref:hypothetical protein n=1 Tax=Secundilactobacillus kimchicus TaxID=528209 RepID=UPI0024A9BDD4|nr:hypothetical protein [Secundilactobacillus kimchicus]